MKPNKGQKLALAKKLQVASELEHKRIQALQAQLAQDAAFVEQVREARLRQAARVEQARMDAALQPMWKRFLTWLGGI